MRGVATSSEADEGRRASLLPFIFPTPTLSWATASCAGCTLCASELCIAAPCSMKSGSVVGTFRRAYLFEEGKVTGGGSSSKSSSAWPVLGVSIDEIRGSKPLLREIESVYRKAGTTPEMSGGGDNSTAEASVILSSDPGCAPLPAQRRINFFLSNGSALRKLFLHHLLQGCDAVAHCAAPR